MIVQSPLPEKIEQMSRDELCAGIQAVKDKLGKNLVILGHHYQIDDVIAFADFTGDSLKLAQIAAEQRDAEYIVFCGVHFMAESADIVGCDRQKVILPDLTAGCTMADMADLPQSEQAWPFLTEAAGMPITPITYVNSSADVKSFVGRNDGACCTSSNATKVLEWALHGATPTGNPNDGHKVLFLPDEHLGRNSAFALGWPLESMVVYDPTELNGGLTAEQVRDARFILWDGYCCVHQMFNEEQAHEVRTLPQPYQIIVHPECCWEVCQLSDQVGSTEYIIKAIREAPEDTYWAVGTEINLVNRLAATYPNKHVRSLSGEVQCRCSTMARIDLTHLYWALDELAKGNVVNQITVDQETARWSRIALERMLELRPGQPVSAT